MLHKTMTIGCIGAVCLLMCSTAGAQSIVGAEGTVVGEIKKGESDGRSWVTDDFWSKSRERSEYGPEVQVPEPAPAAVAEPSVPEIEEADDFVQREMPKITIPKNRSKPAPVKRVEPIDAAQRREQAGENIVDRAASIIGRIQAVSSKVSGISPSEQPPADEPEQGEEVEPAKIERSNKTNSLRDKIRGLSK